MSDQASEAIAYIEREYEDLKGRVEDQRRVVEQLHMVETDAAEAEASLAALLDEEASKLRILCERGEATSWKEMSAKRM